METTEYKPTYEQLEAGLSRAIMVMESAARQIKSKESHIHYIADALNIDAGNIMKSVQPPPTYEEVTVERWECDTCNYVFDYDLNGRLCGSPRGGNTPICESTSFTKLTGTRRVPVKQPVRKRVSVQGAEINNGGDPYGSSETCPFAGYPETFGKTGTLTFEWLEE